MRLPQERFTVTRLHLNPAPPCFTLRDLPVQLVVTVPAKIEIKRQRAQAGQPLRTVRFHNQPGVQR